MKKSLVYIVTLASLLVANFAHAWEFKFRLADGFKSAEKKKAEIEEAFNYLNEKVLKLRGLELTLKSIDKKFTEHEIVGELNGKGCELNFNFYQVYEMKNEDYGKISRELITKLAFIIPAVVDSGSIGYQVNPRIILTPYCHFKGN